MGKDVFSGSKCLKKIYVTDKHRLKNYDINACEVYKYVWSCPSIVYNLEQNEYPYPQIINGASNAKASIYGIVIEKRFNRI